MPYYNGPMRRSTQPPARTLIVLLLLQVTLLGTWTAHALIPPAGPAATHVEAAGGSDCPAVHDADHCLICQSMNLRVLRTSVVRLEVGLTVSRGLPAATTRRWSPQRYITTRRPRAPPVTVV